MTKKITLTVIIDEGSSTTRHDRLNRATGEMIAKMTKAARKVARSYERNNSANFNELSFETKMQVE